MGIVAAMEALTSMLFNMSLKKEYFKKNTIHTRLSVETV
jgi:hypothetical protein